MTERTGGVAGHRPATARRARGTASQSTGAVRRSSANSRNRDNRIYEDRNRRTTDVRKTYAKKKSRRPAVKPNARRSRIPIFVTAFFIAGLLVFAGCIGYSMWEQSFTDITLAEQVSVSLQGYSGRASAEVVIEPLQEYEAFFATVQAHLDAKENLSNGDVIHISFTYDEALAKSLKLRVNDDAGEVQVEQLVVPTIVSIDELFQDLKVTVDGISPAIMFSIENLTEDPFLQTVVYTIDHEKMYYKSGDVIPVTASFDEEEAFAKAYVLEEGPNGYTMSYTVNSDSAYITDAEDITPEMMNLMVAEGSKIILQTDPSVGGYGLRIFSEARLQPQWIGRSTTFSWHNPVVLSAYFNVVASDEAMALRETHVNDVRIAYEVTLTQANGTSCKAEVAVQFTELTKGVNDSYNLSLDSGKVIAVSYRNSNIKSAINDTKDGNYITTKLNL